MRRIALVTAVGSLAQDTDLPLLVPACRDAGLRAEVVAWDDPSVSWPRFDAVVLRSPWDYMARLPAFLHWCGRVDRASRLLNPLPVVRWNTDKHYLLDLAARGIPVVPTRFVEPDAEPLAALDAFLAEFAEPEFVVKPAVSAGSLDTARYGREERLPAAGHLGRLLAAGRSAMLQPYQPAVDSQGETALLYFSVTYSHAIRKAALLGRSGQARSHTSAPEAIQPCKPDAELQALGERILRTVAALPALQGELAYARVDLLRDGQGAPQLLELELCEPSLFVGHAPGAAARFAAELARLLEGQARP